MNIELALNILFSNGYITQTHPDGDMIVVTHPTRRVTVAEIAALLHPFDPRFVTFYQVNEDTQIFFD